MKKLSVLALITALGVAGSTGLSAQAANVNSIQLENGKGYIISGGQACSPEELQEILADLCDKFPNIPGIDKPGNDTNTPDTPDTDKPGNDTNTPDTPDTDKPGNDTNTPDTPDTPDTDKPGNDTNKPDTDKPGNDTNTPDAGQLSYAEQVVALVNAERAKAGLNALTLDTEIASAALIRSKEIETSFSHTRPDGRSFSTVLTDNGIKFNGSGENIAWGQRSPEEVMNGWMNSDGHRANILNPKFTKIGVGHYQNAAGRNYWTQLFTY